MKRIEKTVEIMNYKNNIITIERIKNNMNGNPRYDVSIINSNDIYVDEKTNYMESFRITSYNVIQDIKDYIDEESEKIPLF